MIALLLACKPPTPTPTPVDTDLPPTETAAHTGSALDDPWVEIEGGTFMMGTPDPAENARETPAHLVTLESYAIMRHEVLIGDYLDCEAAGECTTRASTQCHNGNNPNLPVNCIDWTQAGQVCAWLGGRLPTESEWEYAATSRGQDHEYPWGDEPQDCERANTGQGLDIGPSCNGEGAWEVCTHPLGDTELGLCDMGGNMFEWVEDWFWDHYVGHPTDGSARTDMNNNFKTMRGGAIGSTATARTRERTFHPPHFWYGGMGVRCVMDL